MIKKYDPTRFATDMRFPLPENWLKIFHPRPNGFDAYKSLVSTSILRDRPPMRNAADDTCKAGELLLPTEESLTDPLPPEDEELCPADEPPIEPPPTQPSGPTKALDIVTDVLTMPTSLQDLDRYNQVNWLFFQTDYGKKVDCRQDPVYQEQRDLNRLSDVPYNSYPGGTFKLNLFGEDCEYKNSGDNPGRLFCGSREIACVDDPADTNPADNTADKGMYECGEMTRQPVFMCEW
jgi:hypothetical protein